MRKARKKPAKASPENVEAALDMLRQAKTIEQVNARARALSGFVQLLDESPTLHVRAIHIRNMAQYRRLCISKGWG